MITLLILTVPRVRGGPFWIGLQAAGWITTCAFGYLAWAEVQWFFWPVLCTQQMLPRFEDDVNKLGDLPASVIFFTYITVVYTTQLILLSLLGGWIAAWVPWLGWLKGGLDIPAMYADRRSFPWEHPLRTSMRCAWSRAGQIEKC